MQQQAAPVAPTPVRPIDRFHSRQHVFAAYEELQMTQGARRLKQQAILKREDYVINPPETQALSSGEERLRHYEEVLEVVCGERGDFQRELHGQMTMELAENIVGPEDWARIGERLKRARGWRLIRRLLMASAPRRFGKSVALSAGVAAYGVAVPYSIQCIFSTGRRASKNDLEIIYKLVCDLGHKDWVAIFNSEELFLIPNRDNPTEVRKIFSYPSKATISIKGAAPP